MKKNFMFVGIAALMLAGCSSDDLVKDEGLGEAGTGNAYVGLTLRLPSVNGNTRAAGSFEEATDKENYVHSLQVVFVDDSNKIIQVQDYDSADIFWQDDAGAGIGTVGVLPVITVSDESNKNVIVLVNNKSYTITVGNTFNPKEALDVDMDKLASLTEGFFMSSAVLSNDTYSDVVYKVKVEPKKTPAEAAAAASDNIIYVERAVGKVKLETGSSWTSWVYTIPSTADFAADYQSSKVEIKDWKVDVTNKKFYPVRQFDKDWMGLAGSKGDDRFVEKSETPKRVYFAESPFFDSYTESNYTSTDFGSTPVVLTNPQYCPENTFDVAHMRHQQTTRVLLLAQYTPAKVMQLNAGNYELTAKTVTDGTTWVRLGNSTDAWLIDDVQARIKAILGYNGSETVTISQIKAGKHPFTNGSSSDNRVSVNGTNINDAQLTKIKNALGDMTAFVEGKCYYQTLIQHFGSTSTPWGNETSAPEVSGDKFVDYTTSSDSNLKNYYLGRYGVVRNNNYLLTLNKVSAPGAPTFDDIKPTSEVDDVQNYYIQATVKILDWAKRSQSVDL